VECPCCGLAVGVPLIFKKRYRGKEWKSCYNL
jgi:hypothetical protein